MSLYETFQQPPSEFRQAPFWFWNHQLDRETLAWQIDQMAEKGIGGFVMHARHGLITPYLSDAWFDCIRFCCERAREKGMIAWAYDERDWPSGPAGGAVIANPANRLSYLRLEHEEVQGPRTVTFGGDVVCAYAARDGEPFRRIEGRAWDAPEGTWRVAKAVRFECPAILWFESYLDTLDGHACSEFIASTYDKHVEKLGDLKALGLSGFFTDEPALSTYPDDLGRIPWTGLLPSVFLGAKGYDVLDCLPDLFADTERGAQVRHDYWDVAVTMFETAFFGQIEAWCEERGLKLIGHPLGEEPLFFQFRCLGNLFYLMKHFHMPGLDHLTIHVGKGNACTMSPKMVESAALLAGRERTMTETFGESGWGLSLREMKWMADWQIANGINYIIPHAFYYSVAGRRKKDSPPSEFFQAPFWTYYRRFADYTARVTAAMTGGEHVAKVAVLYPMSSVWASFVPGMETPAVVQEMEEGFRVLGETLLKRHRDFVVIDEASFAEAKVLGRTFKVKGLTFEALVLPRLTAIREDALDALRRVAGACTVVAVHDDAPRVLRTAGLEPAPCVALSEVAGVRVSAEGAWADALDAVVADVMMSDAPDIQYLHRRKEGKDLYFLVNTGQEKVKTTVSLEGVGLAEIWDPENGTRAKAPGQSASSGRIDVPLTFAPMASFLIVIDPTQPMDRTPLVELQIAQRIGFPPRWHFVPENGNFYTLRHWELSMEARQHVNTLRYKTQVVTTDDLANLRLILDGVPAQAVNVHEAARPIMAHETDALVLFDGEPLTEELPWEIDPKFRVLDLAGRCRPGTHTIEIVIKNNGWFPQPGLDEYAWLGGDFCLEDKSGLPCLVPPHGIQIGPWEDQGFPYFSGTGAYFGELELGANVVGRRVFLNAGRVGDLLEVEVNGIACGVCPWPPYRVEITKCLCDGPNLIVLKVTNSARNFFEGPDKNNPSGLLEPVWLEVI